MKTILYVLAALCLFVLAATGPAAGSAGSNAPGPALPDENRITSPGDNLTPPSVVLHGDTLTISGTAKRDPRPGVGIWILGTPVHGAAGYADRVVIQPDPTGLYSVDLDKATARLGDGVYHVVIQHPMQNNVLDIILDNDTAGNVKDRWVRNRMLGRNNDAEGTKLFRIQGPGSLQGDDACEALIQAFNDPVVDDIIAVSPALTLKTTGSGTAVPDQQARVPETPGALTGGQSGKTTGSRSPLDLVRDFLSGIF